ncbi:hypothetical protein SUGI_0075690 [Cryptomeria japonica]|nr:hypothetical protein SUGI_0075690 [Cryptomeria japonica]
METYISSLGFDVWMSVKNGYVVPNAPPTNLDAKKKYENNAKAKHAILSGLSGNGFVKVVHCVLEKGTWDIFQRLFEGDAKVKKAKLQALRGQLESIKMKYDEKIADYLHSFDETVNTIRGLGEEIVDEILVKKVLRSLTMKYDTKVSSIEEANDLKTFKMDELFGSLIAYEMRTICDTSSRKEEIFNITKKGKEVTTHEESSEESDVEVANFVRKLKRGTERYKGNLPLKCFNCGKVGHFAANFPHKETGGDESREFRKSTGKDRERNDYRQGMRGYRNQNSLYTIEDDTTDEENASKVDYHENDRKVNLFMVLGEPVDEDEEEEDIETDVDLEDEQDLLKQSLDESSQVISDLKLQLEETKRICEATTFDLTKKEKEHQKLEADIVKLRKELEESKESIKIRSKYEGNTEALYKMLSKQKQSKDTAGLGFEEGQSSTDKDKPIKEIMFTSSIKSEEKKTFTIGKDTDKKTYADAIGNRESNRYTSMNQRPHFLYQHADLRRNERVDREGFTRLNNMKGRPPIRQFHSGPKQPNRYISNFHGHCYRYSGFSNHMTGDKRKFIKCEDWNGGLVSFGDNSSIKIKGKGTLSIDGNLKAHDAYYLEGLKNNLLSVSQMCDKGYKFTFDSTSCQIKKDSTSQIVAEGKRTDGNIYNLKECYESQCRIGQVDESWLWHQRLGHINFDNLVAVSKNRRVRNIPHIIKPVQLRTNIKMIPYELWYDYKPSVKFFKVFGRKCFIKKDIDGLGSFDFGSDEEIFLGYSSNSKAYKWYNKRLRRVVESVNVRFDEDMHKGCQPQINQYDNLGGEDDEGQSDIKPEEACKKAPNWYV